MNKALTFGIGAGLLLAAGTANAGTCTTEIEQLSQTLGVSSDSPHANAGGAANNGVQQPSPTAPADLSENATGSSTDSTSTTTTGTSGTTDYSANAVGAADAGVQQPDPGAEADANAAATNQTDSSTTAPSTTESGVMTNNSTDAVGAADAGVQQPDGGGSDTLTQSNNSNSSSSTTSTTTPNVTETSRSGQIDVTARSQALASLEKAKSLDKAGQEEACMTEVGNAKQQLGVQ